MAILFKPTPKQDQFMNAIMSGQYNVAFYGGAIRGGKTFVSLAELITLCKIYPKSRWFVIRKDATKLELNTIPSFWKLCPSNFLQRFVGNVAYWTNGSELHFIGENYIQDPELGKFDGMEANGFLMEECQELQLKTFNKCMLRAGTNLIDPMPAPIVLVTGNPSQNWSKKVFYEAALKGELPESYFYLPAFLEDNPHLPEEYKKNLESLDDITYQRFVKGDWDVLDIEKPFAYSFRFKDTLGPDEKILKSHMGNAGNPIYTQPLRLSFDFNIDPMTCLVGQSTGKFLRIFKEYRLGNSDTHELCERIKADYPNAYFIVTGDASGYNRSPLTKGDVTHYKIIQKILGLGNDQLRVPSVNPSVSNNRILVNSILRHHPNLIIDYSCKFLEEDLKYCEVNREGDIDKTKNKHRTHLLDCWRYYCNTYHGDFVKHAF